MSQHRHLHLNLVGNENTIHGGWSAAQRAEGAAGDRPGGLALYLEYAALAEEGRFTSLFLGDVASAMGKPVADGGPPEPITALVAVARATRHLGLVATASTTFYDPYNLARLVGSLDQISEGRAGFNAVTSATDIAALNYSRSAHPDRESRYEVADEFLEVVRGLWDKRELVDADGGVQFYSAPLEHVGAHFRVRGPLNVAPSAQGRPLISQAGGSAAGIRVGARHADIVFTNANSREDAFAHRAELDRALASAGRAAGSVPVLPGVAPYLGRTREEAMERKRALDAHLDYEALAPHALAAFGVDFRYADLDDPFPVEVLPRPEEVRNTIKNSYGNYVGLHTWIHGNPGVTVRQVVAQTAGGWTHRKFVGSYDEFVDDLVSWFDSGAADGFSLIAPTGPASVREFVGEIVPRLVARGVYRQKPDERPLRFRFQGEQRAGA